MISLTLPMWTSLLYKLYWQAKDVILQHSWKIRLYCLSFQRRKQYKSINIDWKSFTPYTISISPNLRIRTITTYTTNKVILPYSLHKIMLHMRARRALWQLCLMSKNTSYKTARINIQHTSWEHYQKRKHTLTKAARKIFIKIKTAMLAKNLIFKNTRLMSCVYSYVKKQRVSANMHIY